MIDLVKELRKRALDQKRWTEPIENKAADRIEFLERQMAAMRPIASDAHPISTAPRDGKEIIAWTDAGKNWHPVYWKTQENGNWGWISAFAPHWAMRWNDEYHQGDGYFSHWQPLPGDPLGRSLRPAITGAGQPQPASTGSEGQAVTGKEGFGSGKQGADTVSTETNDRELLVLAAKAAGLVGFWVDAGLNLGSNGAPFIWNPLTDDGDALRLAVKLRLDVETHGVSRTFGFVCASANTGQIQCEEECSTFDEISATRRAIVRAAAQIGLDRKEPMNSRLSVMRAFFIYFRKIDSFPQKRRSQRPIRFNCAASVA